MAGTDERHKTHKSMVEGNDRARWSTGTGDARLHISPGLGPPG